ncbi:Lipoprotein LpqB, GerMN domain protein [Stanieria cyanosphaera PCC 7437]|uniref:Lipoprotein LpqB, GerMN domain protein n=1 Tax=Stanieria cyanosphaera (strain ATCC 29371 / PCC 7437) TaxID=111780 RepID=K9XYF0_STAC7|nr:GerMN domain-containing protein [Stanieria cyanosphaera]AFZ37625.1 Lipoprotein LpqB, GerMN domain protein [Stanieria cyanosphaera PCC 7437]
MHNQKQSRRFSLPLVAGIAGIILALGGGTAWLAKYAMEQSNQSSVPPVANDPPVTEVQPPVTSEPVKQEKQVEICWLNPTENKIELVTTTLTFEKSVQPNQVLETAFKNLLSGPDSEKYTTTIPKETKLLGLQTKPDGVRINLSQEFTSGGGSAAMSGRLAQVIYTATSLNPDAKVWIEVEGKPLETLGGEGLIINQPITRKDFETNFSL